MVSRFLADAPIQKESSLPEVFWRGHELMREHRWTEAIRAARQVLRQTPDHLGALEVYCQAMVRSGDYEEALRTVRRLVRINANEAGYELLRAAAFQAMGRLPEALLALNRARTLCRAPRLMRQIEMEMESVASCLDMAMASEPQTVYSSTPAVPGTRERRRFSGAVPMVH